MTMNRNLKRKLLAGLFVPVLGLAMGTALGQTTSTDKPADKPTTAPSMSPAAPGAASLSAQTFDQLDKNKDGKLSREEAQANPAVRDAWSKLDPTNSGSVSKEDFDKFRTAQAK
jgi:EF hand